MVTISLSSTWLTVSEQKMHFQDFLLLFLLQVLTFFFFFFHSQQKENQRQLCFQEYFWFMNMQISFKYHLAHDSLTMNNGYASVAFINKRLQLRITACVNEQNSLWTMTTNGGRKHSQLLETVFHQNYSLMKHSFVLRHVVQLI